MGRGRLRQFYEAYRADAIVTPLVTQLPWTHNLIILAQSKRPEEREFYLRAAVRERWSKRELERQFRRGLFARTVLHSPKLSPAVRQIHGDAIDIVLKDAYFVEFLDLPEVHTEHDLCTAGCSGASGISSSSWGTTSASWGRSIRCRWAGATSLSTSCSFIAASTAWWP